MSGNAIQHLLATAGENHATPISHGPFSAVFSVDPPSPSGSPTRAFGIAVEVRNGEPVAKEHIGHMLPSCCPERHINFDGTFCLFWAELEPLSVTDTPTAGKWWRKLLTFLQRQGTADILRSWPGRAAGRAHGPEAATHQAVAEHAANELGIRFTSGLKDGHFSTNRNRYRNEHRVKLFDDGRCIATVVRGRKSWEGRVLTLRARCKCGSTVRPLPLRSCGNHAEMIARFTLALDGWKEAEAEFFKTIANSGIQCCGSLEECPLASIGQKAA